MRKRQERETRVLRFLRRQLLGSRTTMDDNWWTWRELLSQVCGVLSLFPNMRSQNNQNRSFFSFFLSFSPLLFSPFHSIRSRSILDSKNSKMNRDDRRSSSAHITVSSTFLPSSRLFFFLSLSPFCSYRQLYYLTSTYFPVATRATHQNHTVSISTCV